MKNFLLKIRKHIPRPSVLRSMIFLLGFGYIGFAYASLFPGPLTGHEVDDVPLGGYVSHAQFERGCSHCHAPLHCIEDDRCQECHVEVAQQKTDLSGLHGLLPGTNRCQNCHVEHMGREADITTLAFTRVDHTVLANFSLDYHQEDYNGEAMDCQSCHTQDSYRAASLDCVTCHAEADHETMAAHIEEHGLECLSCHDGQTRLADFEHNVQAFNLTGAHTELECVQCHTDPELQYGEAPTACENCHSEEEQPAHHPQFGTNCARCHVAEAWAPAQLTVHVFDLQHGLEEGEQTDCAACHVANYASVTCYGCHEDTNGRLTAEHGVNGVVDVGNCIACHPTGVSGEARHAASNFPNKVGTPPEASAAGSATAVPQGNTAGQTAEGEQSAGQNEEAGQASGNGQNYSDKNDGLAAQKAQGASRP